MFKKLSLIILGAVLALIISETFLRLAGRFYYNAWIKKENSRIEQEKYGLARIEDNEKVSSEDAKLIKILCVGDSWTFGAGASPGYSYPAQLQLILDRETPDKYKVYNAGIPGCTSAKLSRLLPEFLEKYKPDIVIILMGMNDMHNPFLPEIILNQREFPACEGGGIYLSEHRRRPYFWLASAISDLRIYKVIKLGLLGLRQKLMASKRDKADAIKDPESDEYVRIGYNLDMAGKTDLAKEYFEKAIDANPDNEVAYLHLGHLYQSIKQYDKALICYERVLEINPYAPLKEDLYRFLFLMYQDLRMGRDTHNKIKSLVRKILSDRTFKNPGMPFILNRELILGNLEHNLDKIIDLIKSKRAMPVMQTYLGEHPPENNALINFSKKRNILLVTNERNIDSNYFAPDNHPNEKGYYLMAGNVYQKIIETLDLHSKSAVNTERIKLY